ncbi:hypothetical protein [Burkholderia stabilis]|uniref:Uncharacterized protein n=1 Tax=Burkholderia stabilis TaxID=95485 RepID=A0A1Y1BX63_9BURK|nr:hypothetical protein [Burkholderia stabilis]BAX62879.1 hypothetical protein BSFP_057470 [Burkholderia stabilis]
MVAGLPNYRNLRADAGALGIAPRRSARRFADVSIAKHMRWLFRFSRYSADKDHFFEE